MIDQQISKEIAQTIMQQLEASFNMVLMGRKVSIFAYIGAKKLGFINDGEGLIINLKNNKHIVIELNAMDTYDVKYFGQFKVIKESNDVYAENLKDVLFSMLGIT